MTGLRPSASPRTGRLCLGFQWDTASWESAAALWAPLAAWLGPQPCCWNLPSLPSSLTARKRASLVKPLTARVGAGTDLVTAMGFSGASHRLLNIDELDREVGWGLRNPWGTGLTDVLGIQPRILVPRVADLDREDAWKVYRGHGFRLVGIFPEPPARRPVRRRSPPPDGCADFQVIRVLDWPSSPARARALRLAASRSLASEGLTRILLDLSGLADARILEDVLGGAAGLFAGRVPELSPVGEPEGDLPARSSSSRPLILVPDWAPSTLPLLHAALDSTAVLSRKRRKKNEEFGALLGALAAPRADAAAPTGAGPNRHRPQRLVAHMLGEVTLAGTAFDVRLKGGRFSGIVRQGRDLLPNRLARSFIRQGRTVRTLRTASSVSFETDHGTGLREELGLDDGQPSVLRIEYAFHDDSPRLVIGVDMDFPELAAGSQVDEYAPIALALRTLRRDEAATVEVSAPDGSTSAVTLSEKTESVLVPGAQHRVRRPDGGWIVMEFDQAGGRAWGLPSFRVSRSGRDRVLEVNPFGSGVPLPAEALRGRHARFSMSLGLE